MTVARLVYYVLPDQKLWKIKATMLTKLLVAIDIVCFLIQAAGGSMMSNEDITSDTVRIGQKLYMGGCGAQLCFILIFCGMMARFKVKMHRDSRPIRNVGQVRVLFWVLYVVLGLIVVCRPLSLTAPFVSYPLYLPAKHLLQIRIIFRLVEFGQGTSLDNPILTNEYYAIGLDAVPMLLGFLLLNAVHPGWVLRGPESEFPRMSRKEKKLLKYEKKAIKEAEKQAKKEAKEAKRAAKQNSMFLEG